MSPRHIQWPLACAAWWIAAAAGAQEPPPPPAESPPAAVGPPAAPPAPVGRVTLPALTHVRIQLDEGLYSDHNKPGDHFRLHIAEDVRVGEAVVIPAGAQGVGEVVHAAASGGGGKPGALILAAREVRVGDHAVRLRSLVLGRSGNDHTQQAMATSFVAGPFAMFVHGGSVVVPAGTEADAKTAEDVELEVVPAPPPAPARSGMEDTTTKGSIDGQQ